MSLYCLSAGFGFKKLQAKKPHSMILASGTLKPLDTLEAELEVPFPIKLENCHVIPAKQVSIQIVKSRNESLPFCLTRRNKNDSEMNKELAHALGEYSSTAKGGVLIFFPSYQKLNEVRAKMSCSGVLNWLRKKKTVYFEDKDPKIFKSICEKFEADIESMDLKKRSGSILMGVCRGRLSEGIDFKDRKGRLVIIVGIPYPKKTDPRITLKQFILDQRLHAS